MIKDLACKYPILRPINPASDELIWLICDASLYGVGTLYRQGEDWKTCRPAGFMSKKLTDAGSQGVDLGQSNNPNTTPTKDYENVRVVVYLRGVQRGCAEEGERGSTPTG